MTDTKSHDPRAVEALAKEVRMVRDAGYTNVWDADIKTARLILTREAAQAERAERLVGAADELRRATINATHALGSAALGAISVPSTLVARMNVVLTTAVAEWHRVLAAYRASTQPEPSLAEAVEALGNWRLRGMMTLDGDDAYLVDAKKMNALMAALARERGAK